MKARVFDTTGAQVDEIEDLPPIFKTELRPDLIKRAVLASRSARRQAYGPNPKAGKYTSAESWGVGRAKARVPRVKGSRHPAGARAAFAPMVVGGRVTHPPIPRSFKEKINKKERRIAIRSSIAATVDPLLVEARGHIVESLIDIPLVVSNDFEQLKTTKEVIESFSKLGLIQNPAVPEDESGTDFGDIDKAAQRKKKVRAGKGKRRGRKYKTAKSVLVVYGSDPDTITLFKAARNLSGVDIIHVSQLNAELLAPGTHPGRLTVWIRSAIDKLAEDNLYA
ncbi:MAG: 50S ribosomal protein L4 [Candidatus Hodarchaeales archaeon]|jgi:large subunit ribosomal protein L4e